MNPLFISIDLNIYLFYNEVRIHYKNMVDKNNSTNLILFNNLIVLNINIS